MSRDKEYEKACGTLLTAKGYHYISAENQTVKCYKCGSFQQVRTEGFDFHVFFPRTFFVECKTKGGKLSPSQLKLQALCKKLGVPYIVVRDTIDELEKFLG